MWSFFIDHFSSIKSSDASTKPASSQINQVFGKTTNACKTSTISMRKKTALHMIIKLAMMMQYKITHI